MIPHVHVNFQMMVFIFKGVAIYCCFVPFLLACAFDWEAT